MSLQLPIRTAVPRCLSRRGAAISHTNYHIQRRAASDDKKPSKSNPILDDFQRRQAAEDSDTPIQQSMPAPGDLAPSSIFEDERRERTLRQRKEEGLSSTFLPAAGTTEAEEQKKRAPYKRDPQLMARVLDPNPSARERWERKKVIQAVRNRGRMTKAEMIMRQEREHLSRSQNLKTSVKKLGHLARQIAGKTVEEAEIQMRFSKKKAAQEVLEHLRAARDEAIVAKGMGLGQVDHDGNVVSNPPKQDVQLKDGSRHTVTDTSKMYIAQAWVGRGPYGKQLEFRARGRVNILRTPWTSISLQLKEEKTRVREWQDRETKRQRQRVNNLWVQLRDKPLQGPRAQYFSW